MSEEVKELRRLKAEAGANVTTIAFESKLNSQTVYSVLRGEASQNSLERVRMTLLQLKERKDKSKTG